MPPLWRGMTAIDGGTARQCEWNLAKFPRKAERLPQIFLASGRALP